MKSFLVVALFVCASYAAILAHNDDGNLADRDDNDGAVIEGQFLDLDERAALCNRAIKKETKSNGAPFEIKDGRKTIKGKKVCCHPKCPQCGGKNCATATNINGKVMTDQDKKCCGAKIVIKGKYCQGRNEGPCIYGMPNITPTGKNASIYRPSW